MVRALLLLLTLLARSISILADCVYHHVDRAGELWTWNISTLTQPHDYSGSSSAYLGSGARSTTGCSNVCRPPMSA